MKAVPTMNIFDKTDINLRDYFAAKAMVIAIQMWKDESDHIPYLTDEGEPMSYEEGEWGTWYPHTRFFAESCYAIADQMIKSREIKND